jgi:hypothetical protein
VALELRLGHVLAARACDVPDARDERARLLVARPQQCFEIARQHDAHAVYADDVPGEPRARLPHSTHVEVADAPAREERERVVGLWSIRIGDDRVVFAIVPAPPHLIATKNAPRHPAVLADRHRDVTPLVREFVRDLESRLSRADHQHAAGWQILRGPIVVGVKGLDRCGQVRGERRRVRRAERARGHDHVAGMELGVRRAHQETATVRRTHFADG